MRSARARRRERIRTEPLREAWRCYLDEAVPLYRSLPKADREELHGSINVLLAEKHFEGAGGLPVTEEAKLVVAAQAAVLLLHRTTDYFPKLVSIVLYPRQYSVREDVETDDGFVEEVEESRAGESWQTGALVLSWEDIVADLKRGAQSVVLHEFAHQLDAEDGALNGAPILADPDLQRQWVHVMSDAFDRLAEGVQRDDRSVLDPYGAEDPAEFFAVATEAFFLDPVRLEHQEPALYGILRGFYRQDPARWATEG
jgi:Mlc titration factor MtfA (ptsG expression regulator)